MERKSVRGAARRLGWILAFAVAALSATGCDGPSCDSCKDSSECSDGEECYEFSDGKNRCATDTGDTCSKI